MPAASPGGRLIDLPVGQVRGITAPHVVRSIPPVQVIRLDFADGSTLLLRDPLPALRVQRALTRATLPAGG